MWTGYLVSPCVSLCSWSSCGVCMCVRVDVFYAECVLCVHVQLIKELLRDGSHPVTSKPQESFTYLDLWLNSAALSEQEQDDIADKDRQDYSHPHLTEKSHAKHNPDLSANGKNTCLKVHQWKRDVLISTSCSAFRRLIYVTKRIWMFRKELNICLN